MEPQVTLTLGQINQILATLGTFPHNQVEGTIDMIKKVCQPQLQFQAQQKLKAAQTPAPDAISNPIPKPGARGLAAKEANKNVTPIKKGN